MKDLFEKFQNSKTNSNRSNYSPAECLALVMLAAQGKNVKQIATVVNRSENSVNYKMSKRGIGDIKSPEDFAKKLDTPYTEEAFANWLTEAKAIIDKANKPSDKPSSK